MVGWWIVNTVVLFVVVPVVVIFANRVIRAGLEITRYAGDILEHGVGLAANLEPVPALADTRDLVEVATGHAVAYVTALQPMVPR